MSDRYSIEYNSAEGFVIVDTINAAFALCTQSRAVAERLTDAFNLEVARASMRQLERSEEEA